MEEAEEALVEDGDWDVSRTERVKIRTQLKQNEKDDAARERHSYSPAGSERHTSGRG